MYKNFIKLSRFSFEKPYSADYKHDPEKKYPCLNRQKKRTYSYETEHYEHESHFLDFFIVTAAGLFRFAIVSHNITPFIICAQAKTVPKYFFI